MHLNAQQRLWKCQRLPRLRERDQAARSKNEISQLSAQLVHDVLILFGGKLSKNNGGRTRTRTLDPLIKSQLLYQLSYAPGLPQRKFR